MPVALGEPAVLDCLYHVTGHEEAPTGLSEPGSAATLPHTSQNKACALQSKMTSAILHSLSSWVLEERGSGHFLCKTEGSLSCPVSSEYTAELEQPQSTETIQTLELKTQVHVYQFPVLLEKSGVY